MIINAVAFALSASVLRRVETHNRVIKHFISFQLDCNTNFFMDL